MRMFLRRLKAGAKLVDAVFDEAVITVGEAFPLVGWERGIPLFPDPHAGELDPETMKTIRRQAEIDAEQTRVLNEANKAAGRPYWTPSEGLVDPRRKK